MTAFDPSATPAAESDPDTLLQASRRLDWRFLLPDPALRSVGYSGPARGALLDSLRLFSESLAMLDSGDAAAQYDLVVARTPKPAALARAAAAVRPGGFLYVEVRQSLRPGGPRPRSPADYVAVIARHGFEDVTAHWHWPNFEACAEIVALDQRNALLLALARRRAGSGARLKSAFGSALVRSGLMARVVPCFSVVGRRRAAP